MYIQDSNYSNAVIEYLHFGILVDRVWEGKKESKGERSKQICFRSFELSEPAAIHPRFLASNELTVTEGVNFPRNRFQVPPAPELSDPIRSVWSVRSVRSVQQDFVFLFSLHLLISIGVLVFYSLAVSFLALSLTFSLIHSFKNSFL